MRWTITLVLLAVPTLASAQETYTLKMPSQNKGDVHRVDLDMRDTMRLLRLDMFGNDFKRHATSSAAHFSYADECLAVDNGTVTSFRRRFESAAQMANNGNYATLEIQGKVLRVDSQNGARQVSWETGPTVPDAFATQLEEELKEGKDKLDQVATFEPLPRQPVKVGESWTIDVTAMVRDCETKHGCKLTGASGTGTLKEVHQGPKGPCAKIEVHIKLPLRTIKSGEITVELTEESGTTLDAVYDLALSAGDSYYQSAMRLHFQALGTATEKDGSSTRLELDTAIELKEQRVGPR